MSHARSFDRTTLGRTGLQVSRIGLGAAYGIGASDVERAFEHGINFLYWGSRRTSAFAKAIRAIAGQHRDDMVLVLQSYSRSRLALGVSIDRALKSLRLDHADILLLGWWNAVPPDRILDAALALREAGKVHHIMVSCHHRPTFARYIEDPCYGAIMVRYNAAHRGAETEVFPLIDAHPSPPGVVAYTATRWGALCNPEKTPPGEPVPRAADCYRFALSHPSVDMCLAGPRDGAELDGALDALLAGPMDEDELAWMRRVGDAVHATSLVTSMRRTVLGAPARLWKRRKQAGEPHA